MGNHPLCLQDPQTLLDQARRNIKTPKDQKRYDDAVNCLYEEENWNIILKIREGKRNLHCRYHAYQCGEIFCDCPMISTALPPRVRCCRI